MKIDKHIYLRLFIQDRPLGYPPLGVVSWVYMKMLQYIGAKGDVSLLVKHWSYINFAVTCWVTSAWRWNHCHCAIRPELQAKHYAEWLAMFHVILHVESMRKDFKTLNIKKTNYTCTCIWHLFFLCTGYKKDTWFAVDPISGTKVQTLTFDGPQTVCPSPSGNAIFIGRTGELHSECPSETLI